MRISSGFNAILPAFRRLRDDCRGAVLIYAGIAAPVFIGMVGLSVDVANWQADKRGVQTIADAAAIGGVLERLRSGTAASVDPAAREDAVRNGFDPVAGDVITVNYPPLTGLRAGKGDSVEVTVRRQTITLFSHLFLGASAHVSARAVAVGEINDICVWALNPNVPDAIKVSGAAEVNLSCAIVSNSDSATALTQSGSGCLTASRVKVVGDYSASCISVEPVTHVPPVIDPLASLAAPAYGACDHNSKILINSSDPITLTPGVYCKGIKIVGAANVTFAPGLYVLESVGLDISGQAVVHGSDVNFYLSPDSSNAQTISIQAGAKVELSAGTTGPLAGVLFYHDRTVAYGLTHKFTGGAEMELEGILYFPTQDVQFSGGASFDDTASMLIANTIAFTGNSYVGSFDTSPVQANTMLIAASLVE